MIDDLITIDVSLMDDFEQERFDALLEELEQMGCIVTR